ncbi:hypothetical protein [Nocardia sp. NPDC005825]|uniref:hypothetical protein n=1 Tax=unclassified Nocardia TaxID=2637762 RepID=UPI00340A4547
MTTDTGQLDACLRFERTILPHTALTEPANVGHRKINWPCRSKAGRTHHNAEERTGRK